MRTATNKGLGVYAVRISGRYGHGWLALSHSPITCPTHSSRRTLERAGPFHRSGVFLAIPNSPTTRPKNAKRNPHLYMRRSTGSSKRKLLNCAYVPEPISSAAETEAKTNPASEHLTPTVNCSGRCSVQLRHPQATHAASPPKMTTTTILSAIGPMPLTVDPFHLGYTITGVTRSGGFTYSDAK